MGDLLSTGLTWKQVVEKINKTDNFICYLNNYPRRANLRKRKNNIVEDRKVWRLIIQSDYKNFVKTILRKNIRFEGDKLLEEKINEKYAVKLNNLLANNSSFGD